jgi:hypothetical protein
VILLINRKEYYYNYDIAMELIKQQMNGHETFFLPFNPDENGKLKSTPPIRWVLANYIDMLKKHWERYRFFDQPMNMYYSLARYKLPMFSYSWRIKSQQQRIWLEEFKNYIIDYMLFIETDSPEIEKSHADAKDIKVFLDKYKIKYSVKASGSKGFHFLVPAEEFDWLSWKTYDDDYERKVGDFDRIVLKFPVSEKEGEKFLDKVLLFKAISLRMKTLLSCSTIDTSVNDIKRVCKTAYSWDVKKNLIAYPLDDQMFENFSNALVTPEKVLSYNNYKRGLLWRNTESHKPELCRNMLVDLGILKK